MPAGASSPWHVRVVPNKFSALARDASPVRTFRRSRRTVNGFGFHDVIVETPDRSPSAGVMPDSYLAEILRVYKTRGHELSPQLIAPPL